MIDTTKLDTLSKAYAAHNKVHAEYVDARWGTRKKVDMQGDHEAIVKHILDLGGKHISKGEALDDTLSDELKEAFKLVYLVEIPALALAKDGEIARSTIQVLRTGTFYHPHYGKFVITQATLDAMVNNFAAVRPKAPTELVVDFEHMSVAEPAVKAPAAGWIKGLSTTDDALWADVEWTAEAADQIRKKEYRFISPEFNLNYTDKETNKKIGPTLLAAALTNRPFLEGMEPVVLSERLANMLLVDDARGLYEQLEVVRHAYYEQAGKPPEGEYEYVLEVYPDYIILERQDGFYKIPYTFDGDDYTFDLEHKVQVRRSYEVVTAGATDPWSSTYIDSLPDTAFAFLNRGGERDKGGRTVPRALRHLPFRDRSGKVDMPHLREALEQLPQERLSTDAKEQVKAMLIKVAHKAGFDTSGLVTISTKGGIDIVEKELRKLLGLDEDADIVEAVKSLKDKVDKASTTVTEVKTLTEKLQTAEAATEAATKQLTEHTDADTLVANEAIVDQAIKDKKLLPKQKDQAMTLIAKDPDSFKAFIDGALDTGPDTKVLGSEEQGAANLTALEATVAAKLGLKEEDVAAQKARDAAGPVSA